MGDGLKNAIIENMTVGDAIQLNKRVARREAQQKEPRYYAFIKVEDIVPGRIRIGDDGELLIGDKSGNWRTEISERELRTLMRVFPGFKQLFNITDMPTPEIMRGGQQ